MKEESALYLERARWHLANARTIAAAAAAAADPDAWPRTAEGFRTVRRVPHARTLRDWEQSRAEPDQTARAYLEAIAGDAEAVQRALRAAAPEPR